MNEIQLRLANSIRQISEEQSLRYATLNRKIENLQALASEFSDSAHQASSATDWIQISDRWYAPHLVEKIRNISPVDEDIVQEWVLYVAGNKEHLILNEDDRQNLLQAIVGDRVMELLPISCSEPKYDEFEEDDESGGRSLHTEEDDNHESMKL